MMAWLSPLVAGPACPSVFRRSLWGFLSCLYSLGRLFWRRLAEQLELTLGGERPIDRRRRPKRDRRSFRCRDQFLQLEEGRGQLQRGVIQDAKRRAATVLVELTELGLWAHEVAEVLRCLEGVLGPPR